MADDIDDLLDEVESKYCASETRKSSSRASSASKNGIQKSSVRKNKNKPGQDSELNAAMQDILDDDGLDVDLEKSSKVSSILVERGSVKCFPVFLSGVSSPGRSATKVRSCDRLHCTSCDNKIVSFDNFSWHKDCDYLFFRNNYPDFSKLKVKLKPARGSRAYCCQCRWMSVTEQIKVTDHPDLKWICKKH